MKALSIRQPWAWLIVNGHKDVENRKWTSSFRGEFYVHASSKLYATIAERERIRQWVWTRFGIDLPEDHEFPIGGIVGRARVIGVVDETSISPWFEGPHGFLLDDARTLPFRPYKGHLGFFDC